jgi:hypothetical protein
LPKRRLAIPLLLSRTKLIRVREFEYEVKTTMKDARPGISIQ